MAHVDLDELKNCLNSKLNPDDSEQATIPIGLENALTLISIFRALQVLRPGLEKQQEWLTAQNETLEGRKPLDVIMMSHQHLAWVSYTLESALRVVQK